VRDLARRYPKVAPEAEKAGYRGTQAGWLVSYLWHTSHSGIPATLEDAIRAAEKNAGRHFAGNTRKFAGTRSSFMQAKAEFSRVLHFWGALSNDQGQAWIPAPQLAAELGISRRTLGRWLRDVTLGFPRPRVVNNRLYFERSPVEAWKTATARLAAGGADPP
jgi:hypothetical protein